MWPIAWCLTVKPCMNPHSEGFFWNPSNGQLWQWKVPLEKPPSGAGDFPATFDSPIVGELNPTITAKNPLNFQPHDYFSSQPEMAVLEVILATPIAESSLTVSVTLETNLGGFGSTEDALKVAVIFFLTFYPIWLDWMTVVFRFFPNGKSTNYFWFPIPSPIILDATLETLGLGLFIWGCPKMVVYGGIYHYIIYLEIIHFYGIFHYKSSSYWGTPMTMVIFEGRPEKQDAGAWHQALFEQRMPPPKKNPKT